MDAECVPSPTVSVPLDVLPEYCLVADAKLMADRSVLRPGFETPG